MTTIDLPTGASRHYRRALIALVVAMFFGLLTLAAIREMRVECRVEQDCLGVDSNTCLGVAPDVFLATGTETRQCEIVLGNIRLPLPDWAQAIIGR